MVLSIRRLKTGRPNLHGNPISTDQREFVAARVIDVAKNAAKCGCPISKGPEEIVELNDFLEDDYKYQDREGTMMVWEDESCELGRKSRALQKNCYFASLEDPVDMLAVVLLDREAWVWIVRRQCGNILWMRLNGSYKSLTAQRCLQSITVFERLKKRESVTTK